MKNQSVSAKTIGATLRPINNKVEWINQGGCGIFAVALAKELEKYGYKPKIVALTHWASPNDKKTFRYEVLPDLRNARNNNVIPKRGAFSHYMVRVGNVAIDSHGGIKIKKKDSGIEEIVKGFTHYYNVLGHISIKDLEYLNAQRCWNPDFDRSPKNVSKLQKLITKQLSKLLN